MLCEAPQQLAARLAVDGDDPLLGRRRLTPARQARVQERAGQGWSHAASARRTGLQRVTLARWLKTAPADAPTGAPDQAVPAEAPTAATVLALAAAQAAPPPAPWASWAPVWQVRAALKHHRWLLLRRPDQLTTAQQGTSNLRVAGPLADLVGVARRFLLDWYARWPTEDAQRRPLAQAQQRDERWRANPDYQALAPRRKGQDLMPPARFARLRQCLRQPHREATNHGAERRGRAFRHGQAPPFRLRTQLAIDGVLRVLTVQAKQRAIAPPAPLTRLCPRGRRPRMLESGAQAA